MTSETKKFSRVRVKDIVGDRTQYKSALHGVWEKTGKYQVFEYSGQDQVRPCNSREMQGRKLQGSGRDGGAQVVHALVHSSGANEVRGHRTNSLADGMGGL